jgi:hypothetical protein
VPKCYGRLRTGLAIRRRLRWPVAGLAMRLWLALPGSLWRGWRLLCPGMAAVNRAVTPWSSGSGFWQKRGGVADPALAGLAEKRFPAEQHLYQLE